MKGLIGKKVGMTQIFDEEGVVIPITLIEAGPCRRVGLRFMVIALLHLIFRGIVCLKVKP